MEKMRSNFSFPCHEELVAVIGRIDLPSLLAQLAQVVYELLRIGQTGTEAKD